MSPETKVKCEKAIDLFGEGNALEYSCELAGVAAKTLRQALSIFPELHQLFEIATEFRGELFGSRVPHIADSDENPLKVRNKIDAYKWYAARAKPARFGEKMEVNVNQTIDIRAALADARQRVVSGPVSDQPVNVLPLPIEVTEKILVGASDCQSEDAVNSDTEERLEIIQDEDIFK